MLNSYSTVIFDCDGVILDSNKLKTEAFRIAAIDYGAEAANALVNYHVANGGISRYAKFSHFLENIVPGAEGPSLDELLSAYAQAVEDGLLACKVAQGLDELRAVNPDQTWMVVSGGDQSELRKVFATRGLASYFNGGIFGSPDTKDNILAREQDAGTIQRPAVFLGDSAYDYHAASAAGLDFIFVSDWSELVDWPGFVADHKLREIPQLTTLLN